MPLARRALVTCLAFVIATLATLAAASERVAVRLEYDRAAELSGVCPDEASFRNLILARLGYDAFAIPEATGEHDVVRIALALKRGRLHVAASLLRAAQSPRAPRALEGAPTDCEALVAAIATTVAIALDPIHAASPVATPDEPPATPPSDDVPPPTVPSAVAPTEPPATPSSRTGTLIFFVSAAPILSGWVAPSVSLGGEAGFGVRAGRVSVEAIGRAETMPASVGAHGDQVTASVFTGSVIPCGVIVDLRVCGVVRTGEFEGRDLTLSGPASHSLYAAVGLRAGYLVRLRDGFALEPTAEGDVPLTQTVLTVGTAQGPKVLWSAPIASFSLSVAAVAFF